MSKKETVEDLGYRVIVDTMHNVVVFMMKRIKREEEREAQMVIGGR